MSSYVVVTGASSGIGEDICREVQKSGYQVIAIGRNTEALRAVSTDFISLDISKDDAMEELSHYLKKIKLGSIKGLVNNAGIYIPEAFSENKISTWKKQFSTNLYGAVNLTFTLLDHLKKSKGSIVNVSSTLGIRPIENTSAYSASKAAMNNWTLSLALELSSFGVNVNAVCPGIVETPIHDFNNTNNAELRNQLNSMQPLNRIGKVSDISPLVVHLLSEKSSWTTGGIFNIDGGILLKS